MKSLSVRLGVFLVIGFIFGYGKVWGADWRVWSASDEIVYLYDANSITRSSKNIAKVWVTFQYTDRGVTSLVKALGQGYENVSHLVALEEINCLDRKSRNLSLSYYSKGAVVLYTDSLEAEWSYIIPESPWEGLYRAVCK